MFLTEAFFSSKRTKYRLAAVLRWESLRYSAPQNGLRDPTLREENGKEVDGGEGRGGQGGGGKKTGRRLLSFMDFRYALALIHPPN